jgi:hypothetical protein
MFARKIFNVFLILKCQLLLRLQRPEEFGRIINEETLGSMLLLISLIVRGKRKRCGENEFLCQSLIFVLSSLFV